MEVGVEIAVAVEVYFACQLKTMGVGYSETTLSSTRELVERNYVSYVSNAVFLLSVVDRGLFALEMRHLAVGKRLVLAKVVKL